jgi:single-stranded-DNA-specific exonuclease
MRTAPARWEETPADRAAACALADALAVPRPVATLLWQRGVREVERARAFLRPSLLDLEPPERIPGLERAAERILAGGARGERICVWGDYDVDGLCGTVLLVEALAELGIAAASHIPHRLDDGYGLNAAGIRLLRSRGVDLLITVDGGANDREELALARELGLEVIITDHHPIEGGELPDALLVHPAPTEGHAEPGLCGAGVAYKLAWGLGRRAASGEKVEPRFRSFLEEALTLAALGTVADVVPLVGDNRAIVAHGLRAIARSPRPGLRALLEVCALGSRDLEASDIGYRLAPHLNAAGRLGEVELALELLRTRDPARGRELAASLAALNRRRKGIELEMVEACLAEVDAHPPGRGPLLFSREGWHAGVAGIVAARLAERLERPVFVVAVGEAIARGSARSTPGAPLTPLYAVARPHALSVGGHALAGGITAAPERLPALRSAIEEWDPPAPAPERTRSYDLAIPAAEATLDLARGLALLAPFGEGNPEPLLRIDGLSVVEPPRLVGRREEHLQVRLGHPGGTIDGIWFRGAARAGEFSRASGPVSVLGALGEDRFRGAARPRLRLVERFR